MDKIESSLNPNLVQEYLVDTKEVIINKMIKRSTGRTVMIHEVLHRKLIIQQHEHCKILGIMWSINKPENCVINLFINWTPLSSNCKIACLGLAMTY